MMRTSAENCNGNRRHQISRRRGERTLRHLARSQRKWLFDLVQHNRLAIAWQPIAEARDPDRIFAHECLLRAWDGDSLIYPDALFGAARVLDCTASLDLTSRALALHETATHNPAGKIFINFAPSFAGGDEARRALRRTIRQVDELGLPRARIVFEITESESLHDWNDGMRVLSAYRDAGFGLALDDFGTGYSSLKLLHQLRPEIIKIDQSLLRDVHLDGCKATITGKLIEIARELETLTVAEGIECAGEYSWARENGADFVQGFYFSVPALPPFLDEAAPLLPTAPRSLVAVPA